MIFTRKDLQKLIIPLIVEQLLGISVGMFDTIMISSLGEAAVSGVSLVDMLNVLMINIFSAFATGGAVICAHEIGHVKAMTQDGERREYKRVRFAAKHLLIVLLITSVFAAILSYFLRFQLLKLTFGGIEDDVMQNALIYFMISAVSYPFIALYNGFAALFRTMGNSKITMIASVIVNILNVVGNALLIFVFKQGVAGAAWATVFARAVGMLVLFALIANKKNELYIDIREQFRLEMSTIRRILRIGIPGCFENSVFQLGRIMVISMIAGFGTVQVAANAVANNLDGLGCIPGQAMSLAMITVVGQCIGAGDYKAANQYRKKLMKYSFVSLALVNTVIIATLPLTLKLYNLNAETIALATKLIIIHDGLGILLWSPSFVQPNALRAAQDVRFTMVISIFSMLIFRVFFTWIIGEQMGMGILGVWIAMVLDWIFRGATFAWRIHSGRWLSGLPQAEVSEES